MQTEDSQKIISRFFQALYFLKSQHVIRGKQTFTTKFKINRWNMNTLEKDMTRDIFQPAWLTYLVEHYNISAEWLLTGRGDIMSRQNKTKKEGAI